MDPDEKRPMSSTSDTTCFSHQPIGKQQGNPIGVYFSEKALQKNTQTTITITMNCYGGFINRWNSYVEISTTTKKACLNTKNPQKCWMIFSDAAPEKIRSFPDNLKNTTETYLLLNKSEKHRWMCHALELLSKDQNLWRFSFLLQDCKQTESNNRRNWTT